MWKSKLINVLKLSVTVGLIAWLVQSGELDLNQVSKILTHPMLALAIFAYWLFGPCIMGSYRWLLLLRGARYQLKWLKAFQLQLIGFFFNSAMPGAVGGDLIKVVYVIRDNREQGKSAAMMSVLLDRIIGLAGLFTIGLIMSLFSFERILSSSSLLGMFWLLLALNGAIGVFFLAALWNYRGKDPFLKLFQLPVLRILIKLYESARVYRHRRRYILYCYGLSILIQFASLCLFYYIAHILIGSSQTVPFADIATIFPIGALTAALPIAPGGIGVGHVAFDRLFNMIGLNEGANVFNLYVLTQLGLNLLGAIPYLKMRGSNKAVDLNLIENEDTSYSAPTLESRTPNY